MKIIDFEKHGSIVRFYLGEDDCSSFSGEGWSRESYELWSKRVDAKYIKGTRDVSFPFDSVVLEPCEDWQHPDGSRWSKDEMKARRVPCIVVLPPSVMAEEVDYAEWSESFEEAVMRAGSVRFFMGDQLSPGTLLNWQEENGVSNILFSEVGS